MAEHDIILYGATGFTGELVAQYLAQTLKPGGLSWALAGRSTRKLRDVRDRLAAINPSCGDLTIYQASTNDEMSLADIAAQSRLVLTTVGPYALHGEPLARACVEHNAHYVDLTGEPVYWRQLITRYHEAAEAKGVILVPCCGFDSIPHDLGALYTLQQLPGEGPAHIEGYVAARGSASGGTLASAVHAMANFRQTQRATRGEGRQGGHRGGPRPRIHFSKQVGRWVAPMPTIDPLVVRRSAKLHDDYGEDFVYHHYYQAKSASQLATVVVGVGAVFALSQTPARKLLLRMRPSGAGPSEAERARGWFRVTFVGKRGAHKVVTEVSGGDPGYGHTSKMIAEAALCLLEDHDRLPRKGGVLTPASAMGNLLIERLRRTGMDFRVL